MLLSCIFIANIASVPVKTRVGFQCTAPLNAWPGFRKHPNSSVIS